MSLNDLCGRTPAQEAIGHISSGFESTPNSASWSNFRESFLGEGLGIVQAVEPVERTGPAR